MTTFRKALKTIFTVSLGCDKNLVDTEVLLGTARLEDVRMVDDPGEAEIILINTCAFIDPAKSESIESILEMAQYKTNGRCETLIVAGCLAQRYATELKNSMPEIDYFIGTGDLPFFAGILRGEELPSVNVGKPRGRFNSDLPRLRATPFYTANIRLSDGCSSACAFCIIPKLRGPHRSRSIPDVLKEARSLLDEGVVELNLIGQDVSAYGSDLKDGTTLTGLLECSELNQGEHWLRLHYLYPARIGNDLLGAIEAGPAILPYFDLPVQHIDDSILAAMNRKDNEKSTRSAIERIRHRFPDGVLRSTVIVGFPGETESKFERLLNFVAEGHFDRLGAFAYSREEGTIAAGLPDQVEKDIREERLARLMEVQRKVSIERLSRLKGQTVDVLVEGTSEESEMLLSGRMWGQARGIDGVTYLIDGNAEIGSIVKVLITDTHDHDIVGKIL